MDRRQLIGAGVAAALAASGQGMSAEMPSTDPGTDPGRPQNYVLVHGAYHGGWCWRFVAAALRAAGHVVHVPTLTGLGERAHLARPHIDLSVHALDVVRVLEFEELHDVVLVGHSYAGHVIPLVADQARKHIREMVFLDAVVAREGQSFPLAPGAREARFRAAIDGYLDAPPDLSFFGIPADHPRAAWVRRHLTPQPIQTFMETVRFQNGGASGIPKTYIRCLQRRDMSQPDPVEAQIKGQPEWSWLTIDSGHDAMVTAPDELTDLLLRVGGAPA